MKKSYFICCCFVLLISSQFILAQDSTIKKPASYLKMSVSYLSDNVYLGRSDSLKTPYITPSLGYYHKSGLYATIGGSYLTTERSIDLFNLTAGYSLSKGKWDGEITTEKYFYNSTSYSVRSE